MKFTYFINHIPRIHQFDEFKNLTYQYWFLYWIGGIIYEEGKYYSDFYFINKSNANDVFEDLDGTRVKIRLDITFYTFFNVGCIFCSKGYLLERAPYNIKRYDNTLTFSFTKFPEASHSELMKADNIMNFPLPYEIHNCTYYVLSHVFNGQPIKILIPEFVVCSYLFFRNTFVTKNLLFDTLTDYLDISDVNPINLKNGEKALRYLYNNKKILPHDIHSIAQFFNITKGNNAVNSLSGNLIHSLSNSNKYKEDHYVHVDLEFMNNVELEVTGISLLSKKENFFFVYEIINLKCQINIQSNYNNIVLEPMFEEKDNDFKNITFARYYQDLLNNDILNHKKDRSKIYYPHRTVFYTGINVFVKEYDYYHSEDYSMFQNFYSHHWHGIYKAGEQIKLAKEFLKNFAAYGIIASILTFKSLDNVISRLTVGNSEYLIVIYELERIDKNIYYIALSADFILLLHNNRKTKILLIDIILMVENIIYNYGLEGCRFKTFSAFDTEHYRSKFGVNIYLENEVVNHRKGLGNKYLPVFVTILHGTIQSYLKT